MRGVPAVKSSACMALAVCGTLGACQNAAPAGQPQAVFQPPPSWTPMRGAHGVSAARIVGGSHQPLFPDNAGGAGSVLARCIIGTDGKPGHCRLLFRSGNPAFADVTLTWLSGPSHPTYRPAIRDGVPFAEQHDWYVTFVHGGEPPPAMPSAMPEPGIATEYVSIRAY